MKIIDENTLLLNGNMERFHNSLRVSFRIVNKFTVSTIINSISVLVDSPLKGFFQYHSLMESKGVSDYYPEDKFLSKLKYNRWG